MARCRGGLGPWAVLLLAGLLLAFPVSIRAGANSTKSSIVGFAPEAEVDNNDDISAEGNCQPEIKQYCKDIEVGSGALADCMSDVITESEIGGESDDVPSVSDACREEVYQYKISRNSNINKNIPLAKACKVDADKYCNVTWFFGYKEGQIIACLRDMRDKLAPACKKQVYKVQVDAALDYRADAQLYEACKDDAANVCKDVKIGGGRVQACLRDNRMQLSWACEEQLFRQETENADDVRLSVRLFVKCLKEKKKFCGEVEPGSAKVKDCLEDARSKPGFSDECKAEIDSMIERRVHDFRLDTRLRTTCESDIYSMCAFFGDLDTIDSDDSSVIRCLQDYVNEIQSDACKSQVKKYQQLAAEDIRFDVPLADACYEDRQKLCASVPPGSARVIRCLMSGRDKLSSMCRAVLFDEEIRFSENIDFQYPMRESCTKELEMYCKDVPHGQARAIRCLQDNKNKKDFSKDCKQEIKNYEQEASSDYRLNYRLSSACQADIAELCTGVCASEDGQICGGTVLRCLTDKADQIKKEACQKEVFYFQKMEVSDFRNDVILAAACRTDVDTYCHKVEPGEGRVHDCLRANRAKLSESCRKEELLLEEAEAENVELRPGLMRLCADERAVFCKDVAAGQARVFRCLAEKMSDPDFGETCRTEIINKLQRRQANWKLDPPLRKACRPAVAQLCNSEDKAMTETGSVYKCLIKHYMDLDGGCQKELGRALHMAFYAWQPGAILTGDCDADVEALCLAQRPNMAKTPGAVGSCLAGLLERMGDKNPPKNAAKGAGANPAAAAGLSDKCRILADVAEPPNMRQAFDASLAVVLLQSQLGALESKTGLPMIKRDQKGNPQSITLTGWTALAGIASILVLAAVGANFAWKRYKGGPEGAGYTLVVKKPTR